MDIDESKTSPPLFHWNGKRGQERSVITTGIVIICLVILIPSSLSMIFFFSHISTEMEEKAKLTASLYIDNLLNETENTMRIVQNTAFYLMEDDQLRSIMASAKEPEGRDLVLVQESITKAIPYYTSFKQKYITSIFLFKNEGTALSSSRSGLYKQEYDTMNNVYKNFSDFSSAKTLVTMDSKQNFSYFVLNYTDIRDMESCGKIVIEVDTNGLMSNDQLKEEYGDVIVILSDNAGNVIFSRNTDKLPKEMLSVNNKRQLFVPDAFDNKDFFHIRQKVANFSLKIDILIPNNQVFAGVNRTVLYFLYNISLGVLIALIIGAVVWIRAKHKIDETIISLNKLSDGDLSVRMPLSKYYEVNYLTKAFNSMAENLNEQYSKAYNRGLLLRESELMLLEAQINPHFIYNVLETINMRALALGQKDISNMVTDLAELMRAHVGFDGRQKIPIREEFRYVRYYLELQKERFQERLKYEIEYNDPALLDYYIPKLTIQPLVENSVVHGLEQKADGGTVIVRLWDEDDSLYISIIDDGIGFDTKTLTQPQETMNHNHVAIDNIRRRIILAYGREGKMSIKSSPGKGTSIILSIPMEGAEIEDD